MSRSLNWGYISIETVFLPRWSYGNHWERLLGWRVATGETPFLGATVKATRPKISWWNLRIRTETCMNRGSIRRPWMVGDGSGESRRGVLGATRRMHKNAAWSVPAFTLSKENALVGHNIWKNRYEIIEKSKCKILPLYKEDVKIKVQLGEPSLQCWIRRRTRE